MPLPGCGSWSAHALATSKGCEPTSPCAVAALAYKRTLRKPTAFVSRFGGSPGAEVNNGMGNLSVVLWIGPSTGLPHHRK